MKLLTSSIALAAFFAANSAFAHGPYVVIRDDGTLNAKITASPSAIASKIVKAYKATGAPIPDVMSVWTNFSMDANDVETLFDPVGNDVTGIGLDKAYGGDGTIKSPYAPLRSVLLHNNVTALPARAALQSAPIQDFGKYIFLLEFSHNWGPAIQLPVISEDGGDAGTATDPNELIGFSFHWSFFFDPGGLAGGNTWTDMGGGTFSASGLSPTTIKYSPIDLYIMGLADKSTVTPFGVLENAVVPSTPKDPFTNGAFNAASFPWFGTTPFTVTGATRRAITIDDVVAANGARVPDASTSPKTFNVAIVLDVAADATDDDIATAEAALDPVAAIYPQAFHDATGGLGTLTIATVGDATDDDAGSDAATDGGDVSSAPSSSSTSSSGCNVSETAPDTDRMTWTFFGLGIIAAGAGLVRRRHISRSAAK